jgi:hypothetical protein
MDEITIWYVIGRYNTPDEQTGDLYEEVLEQCPTLWKAIERGKEYAPWFGDEWTILLRNSSILTGKEHLHEGK